jgi:hypothetical protein
MAIEGLAGILKYKADQAAKEEARNRPKAEYLSSIYPKKTGDVIVGQFLQELDKGHEGYDPERGLGLLLVEHEPPGRDGFKRRANCTDPEAEGEPCVGCERKKLEWVKDAPEGNWKTKTNLYINFATIVDGEKKVFVLSRNANSGFFDQVLQEIADEGSLMKTSYRITKSGSGTQVTWTLKAVKDEMFDTSDLETFDLKETVERAIDYDQQAEYYGAVWSGRGNTATSEKSSAGNASAAAASDDEW